MNIFSLAGLILFFTSLVLVIVIFRFGKTYLHRIWAFFNISVLIWGIGCYFIGRSSIPQEALTWWRISQIGVIFIAVFLYHVIYLICNIKSKRILFFVYLQGIIFLLFSFTRFFYPGVRFVFLSFYYALPGPAYHFFTIIWMSIVFYSHYLLFLEFKRSKSRKKNQILYFFFGSIVGFSGGITNFLVGYGIDVYPFGNFSIPLYCIIVSYAIIRYRLLDISLVVTRTSIFIVIYSLILGVPFIIANYLRPYFIGLFGDNWWLVPMGVLTILATVGPFIYIYIERKAENRLLRDQRRYQDTLRRASSGMIRIRNLRKLLNLIVHIITRTVRIQFAAIFLLDPDNAQYAMSARRDTDILPRQFIFKADSPLVRHLYYTKEAVVYEELQLKVQDNPRNKELIKVEQQLKEINADVAVPSFVGNKLLGFLVLGKKLSGKLYSQDDLNVFSVLANQAALAVENAQFYEDIKETQEQLFQAEKMATVGTMADGLSHQINNRFQALSLISGDSLDVLKTTDVSNCSEEVKETFKQLKYAFERIQTNVSQGGEIVRGLLKYSRPGERGFENIDFNKVVYGALEMAQYKVRLHELDIKRQIPADLPEIKCNLTQLEEVFFNLIDNAYDATRERKEVLKEENYKGKIVISAAPREDNLRITFEDNGIGIKDKDKNKLFTPFFTTKASSRKGTGLGLYVIQKIIGFHEGTISIDSVYGKGTKFEITLPLAHKK